MTILPPKTTQPHKRRITVRHLNPDGVDIKVDWERMVPGSSAFVPCLDSAELTRQLNETAFHFEWKFIYAYRIESGQWGVRFWRTA